jgi:hypothetical protein
MLACERGQVSALQEIVEYIKDSASSHYKLTGKMKRKMSWSFLQQADTASKGLQFGGIRGG